MEHKKNTCSSQKDVEKSLSNSFPLSQRHLGGQYKLEIKNSDDIWLPVNQYRFLTYEDACDILGEVKSVDTNSIEIRISPECQML